MKLDEEDRRLLRGDYGDVAREAMEYQVQVAEFYGAERMVPLAEASAGIDFAMNGDFGLETAEALADRGGRFRVFTKSSFLATEMYRPEHFYSPGDLIEKQQRYLQAHLRMGAVPTYSSLPCRTPQFGEQVSWQGSAIVANSLFGARCNLDGTVGGLMNALAGRVPLMGVRRKENRYGTVAVKVEADIEYSVDWSALGYAVGKKLPAPKEIPVFLDLPPFHGMGNRQTFEVSMVTLSTLEMYHVIGLTPEARTVEEALPDGISREITVTQADMLGSYRDLSTPEGEIDLVAFGGHHIELDEFPRILAALEGKRVKDGVRLWIFTGPQYKAIIESIGWDKQIEAAGGEILYGVSLMFMSPRDLVEKHGLKRVVCDSAKMVKYVRGFGMESELRTIERCIDAAVTGRNDGSPRGEGRREW